MGEKQQDEDQNGEDIGRAREGQREQGKHQRGIPPPGLPHPQGSQRTDPADADDEIQPPEAGRGQSDGGRHRVMDDDVQQVPGCPEQA